MRRLFCLAACLMLIGCAGTAGSPDERAAAALESQGKWAEAVPIRQRILAQTEQAAGADDPRVAQALDALALDQGYVATVASMFQHRYDAKAFEAVETLERRAVAIATHAYGAEDGRLALLLDHLARPIQFLHRPAEAETLLSHAHAIAAKAYGPNDGRVATILFDLAELYESAERFADEEPVLQEDVKVTEAAYGADSLRLADALQHLSSFYFNRRGRYAEAEEIDKRVLAIREKLFGRDDLRVAESLIGIAQNDASQNRPDDAEPLLRRALAIKEKALGPEHTDVGTIVNLLAQVAGRRGEGDESRALLVRFLAISEKNFGPNDANVAVALEQIADLDRRQGKFADAEARLKRAQAIAEQSAAGLDRYLKSGVAHDQALLYLDESRPQDAEAPAQYAELYFAGAYDPTYPSVIAAHDLLARIYQAEGQLEAALNEARHATTALETRAEQADPRHESAGLAERRGWHDTFVRHVAIATAMGEQQSKFKTILAPETFVMAQAAQASSTAQAVAGMAARFAGGSDALASVVRERQDLQERRRRADTKLIQAAGQPDDKRDAAEDAKLRAEIAAYDGKLAELDQRLARDFPKFAEIANPKAVSLAEARKLLGPDEAILAYLVGDKQSFLWVVRADQAAAFRLDIGRTALEDAVVLLRAGLDPTRLTINRPADIPPFDTTAAYKLYQRIFAPAEPLLGGIRTLFIVPDAALQSLPLGVLVTLEPQGPVKDFAGYQEVPWLARRYATAVLPSISALRVLRAFAEATHAPEPFIGIGDPLLLGPPGAARGVKLAGLFRGAEGNITAVRQLSPLPDTANELRAMASALGADPGLVLLRERASKPAVRGLDLTRYRVVAFATHGLVAGEISGLAEPALVLTPPAVEVGPEDDGLLTASEVAGVKLNADWAVLSACNTAADDGSPEADGLSGLAKAFFYAGSRALLVSHWPVFSDAAVGLTTATFKALSTTPGLGRAAALQQAMLALQRDASHPHFAHPMFWAPFIVVGEGGAGR